VRRLFWLGVGIAVGALVVRQVGRAAHAYSPAGLADSARNSAAGVWDSVQDFSGRASQWVGDFVADVREGMALKEAEIHEAFLTGQALTDLDGIDDTEYLDDFEIDDRNFGR
jgi:hypothetical protein